MTEGAARRPEGPLLDRIVTCWLCSGPAMDREWARLESTTLPDLVAAMGGHVAERHPEDLGSFLDIGEDVGLLRPPPNM